MISVLRIFFLFSFATTSPCVYAEERGFEDTLSRIAEWVAEFFEVGLDQLTATEAKGDLSSLVGDQLSGRVTRVVDGDTIRFISNGVNYKVRLASIDAPESDQPWGINASRSLSDSILRKNVSVHIEDVDKYERIVGTIWHEKRNVNLGMVQSGHAWVYRKYVKDRSFIAEERAARKRKIGLWQATDPTPPWEWRRRN